MDPMYYLQALLSRNSQGDKVLLAYPISSLNFPHPQDFTSLYGILVQNANKYEW